MSMNQAGFAPILEGSPRRWDFLAGLMDQQKLEAFVEVGCKEGRTTGHLLQTLPDVVGWAIDPWCAMPEQKTVQGGETYEEWDFAKIEADFWKNIGEHRDRVKMLRQTSEQAANELKDKTFDLVFIDAAHDYESVKADIRRWYPLVREGGVMAGHDFNHKWPGVQRAIAECFDLMQIGIGPDSVWFLIKDARLNDVRAD
jgi:SAM-dependent methyltransferase